MAPGEGWDISPKAPTKLFPKPVHCHLSLACDKHEINWLSLCASWRKLSSDQSSSDCRGHSQVVATSWLVLIIKLCYLFTYLSFILGIFTEGGHRKFNTFSLVFAKLYTLLVLSKGKAFHQKYMKYDLCLSSCSFRWEFSASSSDFRNTYEKINHF